MPAGGNPAAHWSQTVLAPPNKTPPGMINEVFSPGHSLLPPQQQSSPGKARRTHDQQS
jgi:hypothetical protein